MRRGLGAAAAGHMATRLLASGRRARGRCSEGSVAVPLATGRGETQAVWREPWSGGLMLLLSPRASRS